MARAACRAMPSSTTAARSITPVQIENAHLATAVGVRSRAAPHSSLLLRDDHVLDLLVGGLRNTYLIRRDVVFFFVWPPIDDSVGMQIADPGSVIQSF